MLEEILGKLVFLLGIDPKTLPSVEPGWIEAIVCKDFIPQIDMGTDLSDAEFEVLMPVLPPEPLSARALTNRAVLNALLWSRRPGRRLTQLPARYGSAEAVRKRAERWAIAKAWDRLLAQLATIELSEQRRAELRNLSLEQARRGEKIRMRRLTKDV